MYQIYLNPMFVQQLYDILEVVNLFQNSLMLMMNDYYYVNDDEIVVLLDQFQSQLDHFYIENNDELLVLYDLKHHIEVKNEVLLIIPTKLNAKK